MYGTHGPSGCFLTQRETYIAEEVFVHVECRGLMSNNAASIQPTNRPSQRVGHVDLTKIDGLMDSEVCTCLNGSTPHPCWHKR